jgi:hypothetical protein
VNEKGIRDSGLGIRKTFVGVLVLEAIIIVLLWVFQRAFS